MLVERVLTKEWLDWRFAQNDQRVLSSNAAKGYSDWLRVRGRLQARISKKVYETLKMIIKEWNPFEPNSCLLLQTNQIFKVSDLSLSESARVRIEIKCDWSILVYFINHSKASFFFYFSLTTGSVESVKRSW